MKNYDETINSVFDKIESYNKEQKRKKNFLIKTVMPLSCLCLALVATVLIFDSNKDKTPIDTSTSSQKIYTGALESQNMDGNQEGYGKGEYTDSNISEQIGVSSNSEVSGSIESEHSYHPNRFKFIINEIKGEIGAAKLYFSEDKYYKEEKNLDELKKYYGQDFSKLDFIDDIFPKGFEYSDGIKRFYYEKNGNIAYDTSLFCYYKEEQSIKVFVSKIGVPYDCIYKTENNKKTNVNGVEVLFGGITKNDNFEFVYADFAHNGLNYRITVENVVTPSYTDSPNMLYRLVSNLTK